MKRCYQCDRQTSELSKRSRCVHCECERSQKNEAENERLRNALQEVVDAADGEGWKQLDPTLKNQREALK